MATWRQCATRLVIAASAVVLLCLLVKLFLVLDGSAATARPDAPDDNPAVGFYQAHGLRILSEVHSPYLSREHGFPGELRMAVTL